MGAQLVSSRAGTALGVGSLHTPQTTGSAPSSTDWCPLLAGHAGLGSPLRARFSPSVGGFAQGSWAKLRAAWVHASVDLQGEEQGAGLMGRG